MIGISLLTLVPGEIGGAETAARGLVAGLADVGTLEYRGARVGCRPGGNDFERIESRHGGGEIEDAPSHGAVPHSHSRPIRMEADRGHVDLPVTGR